jgi:hypothetical protein
MRKLIMVAVTAAALTVPSAALANASPTSQSSSSTGTAGITETGWTGSTQGGGTKTTQYKTSYNDGWFFGPVTCSGVNQQGKSIPSSYGQDSFTCISTDPSGSFTAGGWQAPYIGEQIGWVSDFWALKGTYVLGTMTITAATQDANGNVVSYTGVGSY